MQNHRDLQSALHNVCVFNKDELVNTVQHGDPILIGVMNKSYELKAQSERLYRSGVEVVNSAAGQASVIQAQRDYATRKWFDEFQNRSRLRDKNIELEFDRQTTKAYVERGFKDECNIWKGELEKALSQANLEIERANQESAKLHDENDRLWGMYRGLREEFHVAHSQDTSGAGKRKTTVTPELSEYNQALVDNIDNHQFHVHSPTCPCLMCRDGRNKKEYLKSDGKSPFGKVYPVGHVSMVEMVQGRRIPMTPGTPGASGYIGPGGILCMKELGQFNSMFDLRDEVQLEVDLIYLSGRFKGASLNAIIESRSDPTDPPPQIRLPPFPTHTPKAATTMAQSSGVGRREHLP